MSEAPRVHHLAVQVRDLERAEAFYVGVLGLAVLRRWHDGAGELRSIWVELGGGAFLALERTWAMGAPRTDEAPGWHCVALAIEVSERETWRERLTRAGYPVFRETPFTIYTRDPEGHIVGFSHYPETAASRA
jgi:catechol 2,3-dioxygenase-like lactoylglutathione lyase family enzyme